MIRINLLPFRAARTKENVRRQISVFVLLIVLMLVAMAAFTTRLTVEKSKTQEMVATVTKELASYTKQAKEVDKLKKESGTLQKKINIISKLKDIRKEPVVLFTALTETVVPERMWLNSFDTKKGRITIIGTALDEITVADFAKRLENSVAFINVSLKFLKHGMDNKVAVKKFEINCKIGKIKNNEAKVTSKVVR